MLGKEKGLTLLYLTRIMHWFALFSIWSAAAMSVAAVATPTLPHSRRGIFDIFNFKTPKERYRVCMVESVSTYITYLLTIYNPRQFGSIPNVCMVSARSISESDFLQVANMRRLLYQKAQRRLYAKEYCACETDYGNGCDSAYEQCLARPVSTYIHIIHSVTTEKPPSSSLYFPSQVTAANI